jgi:hypothetical protein
VRHRQKHPHGHLPPEAEVIEHPERRLERHPVRVQVHREVGGDVDWDVHAAAEVPALVEVGLSREPVRRREVEPEHTRLVGELLRPH